MTHDKVMDRDKKEYAIELCQSSSVLSITSTLIVASLVQALEKERVENVHKKYVNFYQTRFLYRPATLQCHQNQST